MPKESRAGVQPNGVNVNEVVGSRYNESARQLFA